MENVSPHILFVLLIIDISSDLKSRLFSRYAPGLLFVHA